MAADTAALRRWLLEEARALQTQQDASKVRLEVLRSILRLVAKHESTTDQHTPEPTP